MALRCPVPPPERKKSHLGFLAVKLELWLLSVGLLFRRVIMFRKLGARNDQKKLTTRLILIF